MKPLISNKQYVLLLIAFITGSVLLLSFMDNNLKQDAWSAVPAGFLLSLPFILCYIHLCKRFPGKNILQINDIVYGAVLGRVVSLFYVVYFFVLTSFNMRDMGEFYTGFILPGAPMLSFIVVAALVSSYAVNKGLVPIARICVFIVTYNVITMITTGVMLIPKIDLRNFLPMFETPLPQLLRGYHIIAALPFGEAFVFMMVMPGVENPRKLTSLTLGGVAASGLILLLLSLRNTAVLGPASAILVGNTYQTARMINVGDILTRIELFTAIAITLSLFIKITTCHFALIKGVTHMLNLRTGKPLIVPLALICAVMGYIAFQSIIEHFTYAGEYHMFYPLLPEFILPPVTILVAALRHRGGAQRAAT